MAKTKANEREFQGQVISWIKTEIDKGGLPFGNATNDSSLYGFEGTKFPDVLLTLDKECQEPFCGWELKTPKTDVRNKELLKNAVWKAHTLGSKYFVTWNMRSAIIWKTPEGTRAVVKEDDKIREFGPEHRINDVEDLRDGRKAELLEQMCCILLRDLARLKKNEYENLPVADTTIFVGMVGNAANKIVEPLLKDINKARSKKALDKELRAWAAKQGVSKYDQDFWQTLAQQMAYKIIGKILFYITLRRHWLDLPRMDLKVKNTKEATKRLRELFQQALLVDYQAIFESDITDKIELSVDSINIVIDLTENLRHWSFEMVPLDVIGNVFEKLVPEEARHTLGQYFTPDNLVDLITAFCIRSGDDYVMDPTCGTGTFLIRGYNRLKSLKRKPHHELLTKIWGFDIAGFPAELATINLCRQDMSDYQNFPRVLSKDFFSVTPGSEFEFPPPKKTLKTGERIKVKIPKFDALVGNFPFIRQELIEKQVKGYKELLEEVLFEGWYEDYPALFENKTRKGKAVYKLRLSGKADIYAYMFFHAAAHLKMGGRMGFITSNSWLDVAYGYELQKFFLSKFKIIAICESRCEPWFEQSAVNTVFTILERCDNKKSIENNYVRFVKIKKPLRELFPESSSWDMQARWNKLEHFVDRIEGIAATGKISKKSGCKKLGRIDSKYVKQPEIITNEDDDIRIRIIQQSDLYKELIHEGQTVKWGQYLRAPDIYFKILEKCSEKLVPFSQLADIRFGIKTGINEFFYLKDEDIAHWGIEKKFLKPVIKSPKESGKIFINEGDLKSKVFLCHKNKNELKGTKALRYIEWGEQQATPKGQLWKEVPSVKGRKNWYELPTRTPGMLLVPMVTGSSLRCTLNKSKVQVDHNLFEILTEDALVEPLAIFLNSGISFLERERTGRANLGDGALKVEGVDWKRILVPSQEVLKKIKGIAGEDFKKLCRRKIKDIKTEARRKDRGTFEKSVLKAFGLKVNMADEIMNGVVELVEERHLLPKLRKTKKKKRVEQDLEKLSEEVSLEVLPNGTKKFPEGFVKGWNKIECEEICVNAERLKLGERFFDNQQICDEHGEYIIDVDSEDKGKYLVYAKRPNEYVIKVPKSIIVLKKAVRDYEYYLKELKQKLYKAFMEQSGEHGLAESLARKVFQEYDLPDIE